MCEKDSTILSERLHYLALVSANNTVTGFGLCYNRTNPDLYSSCESQVFGSVNDEDEGYCYTVAEFRALLQAYIDKLTKAQTDLDKAQADYDAKLAAYNAAQDEEDLQQVASEVEETVEEAASQAEEAAQEASEIAEDTEQKLEAIESEVEENREALEEAASEIQSGADETEQEVKDSLVTVTDPI